MPDLVLALRERQSVGGGAEGERASEHQIPHGSVYFGSNEYYRQWGLQRVELEIVSSWPL